MTGKLVEVRKGMYINPRQCRIEWVRSQVEDGENRIKMEIICKKTQEGRDQK